MHINKLLTMILLAAAGVFSAIAIGACGADDEVTADPDEEVQIRITDTALDPSRVEVAAGTIRFRIDNDSAHTHKLVVETQNGEEESNDIAAGDSGSLTVELDEGEHAMYDPLENYRERGVNGVVVVSSETETETTERTVTDEDTETVIEEETETVTEQEQQTVTQEQTVTQQTTTP